MSLDLQVAGYESLFKVLKSSSDPINNLDKRYLHTTSDPKRPRKIVGEDLGRRTRDLRLETYKENKEKP